MNTIKKISTLFFVLTLGFLASCQKDNAPYDGGAEASKPYYSGVFVLNEGNFTDGQGHLDYICPKNKYISKVFETNNKKTLGNVVQDMFISGGRIYIVSQNGDKVVAPEKFPEKKKSGVGYLSIIDQSTQKLIKAYKNDELKELKNPSYIVVIDGKVYIRDGKGIYLLDTATDKLTFIEGTEDAATSYAKLLLLNRKVYAKTNDGHLIVVSGMTAEKKALPVKAVAMHKSYDGKLWLVSETATDGAITKYDPETGKIIATHTMPEAKLIQGQWGALPKRLSATQDTIYFSAKLQVYRHIFKANKTEEFTKLPLIDNSDKTMIYNGFSVDPSTGNLYITTIKGYGPDYLTNSVLVFAPNKELKYNFKNQTAFPAGVYPVASFK